jgi:elongation factor Ts
MVTVDQIKQLREETDVSITDCKKALEEAKGDVKKAKEILKKLGRDFARIKKKREVKAGLIESYIHSGKKIGAMIELHCETDFVARSEDFQKLAHELCLQIAAISPEETPLLKQPWIRDETKTVKDLIDEYISKFGENIILKRFARFEI